VFEIILVGTFNANGMGIAGSSGGRNFHVQLTAEIPASDAVGIDGDLLRLALCGDVAAMHTGPRA